MANTRPAAPRPDWATNATYTSGPDIGANTKLQPLSGEVQQGYFRTGRPPARKLNWQLNKIGAWVTWLADHVLDGENGGTWAPDAAISIGGGGLSVTGPFSSSGGSILSGGILILDTLHVLGGVAFDATVTHNAASNFVGFGHFLGNATVDGLLTVSGAGDYTGPQTFHGSGIGTGSGGTIIGTGTPGLSVASGAVDITPVSTFREEIILAGNGRIRERVVYAPDADHVFAPTDGTVIVAQASVVTTTRVWTLSDGTAEGQTVELVNYTTATMTVHKISGGLIGTVPVVNTGMAGRLTAMWVNSDGTTASWHTIL